MKEGRLIQVRKFIRDTSDRIIQYFSFAVHKSDKTNLAMRSFSTIELSIISVWFPFVLKVTKRVDMICFKYDEYSCAKLRSDWKFHRAGKYVYLFHNYTCQWVHCSLFYLLVIIIISLNLFYFFLIFGIWTNFFHHSMSLILIASFQYFYSYMVALYSENVLCWYVWRLMITWMCL